MRAIFTVQLDKVRPALMLTRPEAAHYLNAITFAPITTTVRGGRYEVPVGPENGVNRESVVNLDNLQTVPIANIAKRIGSLGPEQERQLADAMIFCFDLLV